MIEVGECIAIIGKTTKKNEDHIGYWEKNKLTIKL